MLVIRRYVPMLFSFFLFSFFSLRKVKLNILHYITFDICTINVPYTDDYNCQIKLSIQYFIVQLYEKSIVRRTFESFFSQ